MPRFCDSMVFHEVSSAITLQGRFGVSLGKAQKLLEHSSLMLAAFMNLISCKGNAKEFSNTCRRSLKEDMQPSQNAKGVRNITRMLQGL